MPLLVEAPQAAFPFSSRHTVRDDDLLCKIYPSFPAIMSVYLSVSELQRNDRSALLFSALVCAKILGSGYKKDKDPKMCLM